MVRPSLLLAAFAVAAGRAAAATVSSVPAAAVMYVPHGASAFAVPSATRRRTFVPPSSMSSSPWSSSKLLSSSRRRTQLRHGLLSLLPLSPSSLSQRSSLSSSSLHMCICINCSRVTDCAAYHFVENKHEQPHINPNPKFEPRDGSPTINATFRTIMTDRATSEFERMMKEHAAEEVKAVERAKVENPGVEVDDADDSPVPLFGEEKYDLSPVTTVEYDVVECEDYVEDRGCWVRNMPEEIRIANPDFVPT